MGILMLRLRGSIFVRYYKNFLAWDLNIGEELGPDHVFYFTLRDAVNFGVGEPWP